MLCCYTSELFDFKSQARSRDIFLARRNFCKSLDNLCIPVTTNGAAQYSCAKLHELYGHSFNSALTSQSIQRPGSSLQYPNAPQPESTPAQGQQFLIQVFLINRLGLDESEANEAAEALAAKIHVTGYGLYMLSKETLVGTLGLEGEVIYRILQDRRYRYVSQS